MRNLLLIIAIMLISTISRGQFIDRITFNFGVTNTDLEWKFEEDALFPIPIFSDLDNREAKGFYSGIDIEYFSSKYFSLSTGIGFFQKGGKFDWGNRAIKSNLDYLTFDTKIKVKYELNSFTPYIIIGPRIDYLLKFNGPEFEEFFRYNILNKYNYGLVYGLGVQYDFKKIILGLSWQNNASFNPIVVNDGEYMRPPFRIIDKSMNFSIDFGIRL